MLVLQARVALIQQHYLRLLQLRDRLHRHLLAATWGLCHLLMPDVPLERALHEDLDLARGAFLKAVPQNILAPDFFSAEDLIVLEMALLELFLEGDVTLVGLLCDILVLDLQLVLVVPAQLEDFDPALDGNSLLGGKRVPAETLVPPVFLPDN